MSDDKELDSLVNAPSATLFAAVVSARRDIRELKDNVDMMREAMLGLEKVVRDKEEAVGNGVRALSIETVNRENAERELRELKRELEMTKELKGTALNSNASINAAVNAAKSSGGDAFSVLVDLENALKSKLKENEMLAEDIKSLNTQLRTKDRAYAKLAEESRSTESNADQIVRLNSQVKMLNKQLADMKTEAKTMERLFRLKTKQLEKGGGESADRENFVNQITALQNELKARDRKIRDLEEERKLLSKIGERKTKELVKKIEESEETPFAQKAWQEERRTLLAELAAEKEKRLIAEKSLKADNQQMLSMAQRLDYLSTIQPAARKPGSPSSHHNDTTTGEVIADTVPGHVADSLMRENKMLKKQVVQRDTLLLEKDAVIESLERKSGILDKARNVESRKGRQEAAAMASSIAELKYKIVAKTEEFKEKELQLRMQNLRLKNQLKAANSYIVQVTGTDTITFDDRTAIFVDN